MRVNPQFLNNTVAALNATTANEQTFTTELSTGVKVNSISDDPTAYAQNVLLTAQLNADDTFSQTAASTQSLLQVGDTALGSVASEITQAISLATEGSNGTSDSSNLTAIAAELSGIRDQVLSLANSSYLGNYIFSGSLSSTPPFALDTSTSPATVTYQGDSDVGYVQTPNGHTIQTNVPGNQIFTSTAGSVLDSLNALVADFSSGTPSTSSISDLESLRSSLGVVDQQRTILDNSITQLTAASSASSSEAIQLQSAQNALIQVDTAQVATQLSSAETQQAALTNVIAALEKQGTLFDQL
jgi:flagellar hook-associated protein 3 FlgL